MTTTTFRLFHRQCLVAFLVLALFSTTGMAQDDDDNSGNAWLTWSLIFGGAAAGVISAAPASNDSNLEDGVTVRSQPLKKSPQKVKKTMAAFNNGLSGIASEDIRQIVISTTMDTSGSPVFGLTGPDVPVTIFLMIRPGLPNGPTENFNQGAVLAGKTLQDNFIGYQADQILAIYIRVGEVDGTGEELRWLNPASGKTPVTPNSALSFAALDLPDGTSAEAWFNGDLLTVDPTAMAVTVNGPGGSFFNIGQLSQTASTFDFNDGLIVYDGINFGGGTITPFEARKLSDDVSAFLNDARAAAKKLIKAHKKSDNAEKRAKRKGVNPKRFPPAKRAEKKVKILANKFANTLSQPSN